MLPHQAREMVKRRKVGNHVLPAVRLRPAAARLAPIREDLARVGGEEGVARPTLATLERLEEEAVAAAMEFMECRDGGVTVEHHLARHGHDAARRRAAREVLEAAHFAPATT
jgi:hypothetical protein